MTDSRENRRKNRTINKWEERSAWFSSGNLLRRVEEGQ